MIAPTAPARCALSTLVKKSQSPRAISAKAPVNDPALREEQPRPSLPSWDTSRAGAASVGAGLGPSPNSAGKRCPPEATAAKKRCELVDAPTVIADGAVPGVLIVLSVG